MKKHTGIARNKVMVGMLLVIALLVRCIDNPPPPLITNSEGEQFAGAEACKSCHANIYNSFVATAHNATSAPGDRQNVKGSFEQGDNLVYYTPYDLVAMEERDSGLYQASYYKTTPKKAARIDMVIGSGVKGQSYLYWDHQGLYQLPVSYFAVSDSWANSPGNGNAIVYTRPVFAHCLECHTTAAKLVNNNISRFEEHQLLYGVSCEGCHGAAAKHVNYQKEHPTEKTSKFVTNPGKLSRLQQMDQCGLCHSGIKENLQPAFSFQPGDTLSHFYAADRNETRNSDVHGNKYNLLRQSACYINSTTLTCNSCHNTHQNERGKTAGFSAKCMSCHTEAKGNFCKLAPSIGNVITTNCIDCHMPLTDSEMLRVYLPKEGKTVAASIRQHLIGIYPEKTGAVMEYLKEQ